MNSRNTADEEVVRTLASMAGFAPVTTHRVDSLELVQDLIRARLGVGLLPLDQPTHPDVAVLPLRDPDVTLRAYTAIRRGRANWALLALVSSRWNADAQPVHVPLPSAARAQRPSHVVWSCEDSYMFEVHLPEDQKVPELTRSFAACLASVTETPIAEVPQPRTDLSGAISHWRSWLAGRGAGLVTLAKPSSFNWPGYWLAVLGQPRPIASTDDATAVLMFGTPSGVVLSPQDPSLLGRAATDLPIREGYVLSGLDPAFIATTSPLPHLGGTVAAIALAEQATGDMRTVDHAKALANRGLDGDRYAAKAGTFTPANDTARGYDLTLIEAEVLDSLTMPEGRTLGYAEARRNIITRGIDLNALVGRRFRVGNIVCMGQRLCEPCSHLERLTIKGALRGLIHRGGLRADVLTDGEVTTGDLIETMD